MGIVRHLLRRITPGLRNLFRGGIRFSARQCGKKLINLVNQPNEFINNPFYDWCQNAHNRFEQRTQAVLQIQNGCCNPIHVLGKIAQTGVRSTPLIQVLRTFLERLAYSLNDTANHPVVRNTLQGLPERIKAGRTLLCVFASVFRVFANALDIRPCLARLRTRLLCSTTRILCALCHVLHTASNVQRGTFQLGSARSKAVKHTYSLFRTCNNLYG